MAKQKRMFDTFTYYDSASEMGTAFKQSIHKYVREEEHVDKEVSQ